MSFGRVSQRIADYVLGYSFGSYSLTDEAHLGASCAKQALLNGYESVVLAVGANKDDWSASLLKFANPEQLVMFEPQESLRATLDHRFGATASLAIHTAAVGREPGVMTMYRDRQGSTLASLYPRDIQHHGHHLEDRIEVPVVRLDDFVEANDIGTLAYLKLDVEGHELEVLRGAARLLEDNRVYGLAFQFGGANIDSRIFFKNVFHLLLR
jgi:FkbM family methyltransferase